MWQRILNVSTGHAMYENNVHVSFELKWLATKENQSEGHMMSWFELYFFLISVLLASSYVCLYELAIFFIASGSTPLLVVALPFLDLIWQHLHYFVEVGRNAFNNCFLLFDLVWVMTKSGSIWTFCCCILHWVFHLYIVAICPLSCHPNCHVYIWFYSRNKPTSSTHSS